MDGLDHRPFQSRSALHSAGHHGRVDVHSDETESRATGSGSGEGDADFAAGVFRDVLLLPGGIGAVLDDAEYSGDRPAVVH